MTPSSLAIISAIVFLVGFIASLVWYIVLQLITK